MNNRQNGRRRGRGGQQTRNGQPNPHSNNRIDNRQRGNAAQLLEKYKTLARDAQMAGDRVNTEYYLQFADHYFRVLSENRTRFEEQQQQRRPRDEFGQEFDGEDEGNPFTRPYNPRESVADDNWDEEEGDQPQAAPSQPAPQAQPSQPRRERERDRDREFQPRGERRPRGESQRSAAQANGHQPVAPLAPEEAAPRSDERRQERRPAPSREAETPARIEIALPPALTAAPAQADLPIEAEAAPAAGEEAAAPKRRRTRKPKAETTPVEV